MAFAGMRAVPGQGSPPLPIIKYFGFGKETPAAAGNACQTAPVPRTCPADGGEVLASGTELASALTFMEHVPAVQLGAGRKGERETLFLGKRSVFTQQSNLDPFPFKATESPLSDRR